MTLEQRVTQLEADVETLANMISKLVDALGEMMPVELVVEWNERDDD